MERERERENGKITKLSYLLLKFMDLAGKKMYA